jgi:hypothetical protein
MSEPFVTITRAARDIGMDRLSVSQKQAAEMLGVTVRTLFNWEQRGLIRGERPAGGVKLYPLARLRELAGTARLKEREPKREDRWPR